MTDKQQGGAAWELGQAATRMVQAMILGDAAEMEAAMSDYAAALGSQATSSMAALATPLMAGIVDLRSAIAALDARIDRSDRARLDRNTHLQTDMDARFDIQGASLDRIEHSMVLRQQMIDNHEKRIVRIEQHLGLGDEAPGGR